MPWTLELILSLLLLLRRAANQFDKATSPTQAARA